MHVQLGMHGNNAVGFERSAFKLQNILLRTALTAFKLMFATTLQHDVV